MRKRKVVKERLRLIDSSGHNILVLLCQPFGAYVQPFDERSTCIRQSISETVLDAVGTSFPILGNVERPFELQVFMPIIIGELGNGVVMTSGHHARGRLIRFELLLVDRLVLGVGCKGPLGQSSTPLPKNLDPKYDSQSSRRSSLPGSLSSSRPANTSAHSRHRAAPQIWPSCGSLRPP